MTNALALAAISLWVVAGEVKPRTMVVGPCHLRITQMNEHEEEVKLKEFEERLKQVLRWAEDNGLDTDKFCELAEYILENGWGH